MLTVSLRSLHGPPSNLVLQAEEPANSDVIGQLEQGIQMLPLGERLAVDLHFECGLGQSVAKEHYGSGWWAG